MGCGGSTAAPPPADKKPTFTEPEYMEKKELKDHDGIWEQTITSDVLYFRLNHPVDAVLPESPFEPELMHVKIVNLRKLRAQSHDDFRRKFDEIANQLKEHLKRPGIEIWMDENGRAFFGSFNVLQAPKNIVHFGDVLKSSDDVNMIAVDTHLLAGFVAVWFFIVCFVFAICAILYPGSIKKLIRKAFKLRHKVCRRRSIYTETEPEELVHANTVGPTIGHYINTIQREQGNNARQRIALTPN